MSVEEKVEDVFYWRDWRGKQSLGAQSAPPKTMHDAVAVALNAVFMEVERYNEHHAHDEGFVDVPIAALILNASNRLPPALRETILSIEWLRSEGLRRKYDLDDNLQQILYQPETQA